MTKRILTLMIVVLSSLPITQAQSFSIKIFKVYPAGGLVDGDSYNLSGELDKAEVKFRNLYTGKDANYTMELIRPSGDKETKHIQNIIWILSENGEKKNMKSKPKPADSYPKSTNVEYYSCDLYGKPKSNPEKFDYVHYFIFYKGTDVHRDDKFWTRENCKQKATEYFTANKVETQLCKVIIYGSKDTVIDSINNRTDYEQYLAKQKYVIKNVENLEKDTSEVVTPVYDKQKIEKQLIVLKNKANLLQKGPNFMKNMQEIIEEADIIITILEVDTVTFNKNEYFGTTKVKDLKAGIQRLIEINSKKGVEPVQNQNPPKTKQDESKATEQTKDTTQANKKEIDKQLKELQQRVNKLKKGSENYRQERDAITNEAEQIAEMLNFDKKKVNRYFNADLDDLKEGIRELIRINNERK